MTMYNRENIGNDFYERTFMLIEQYNKFIKEGKKEETKDYMVTLLINCFMGTLVLFQINEYKNIELASNDILNEIKKIATITEENEKNINLGEVIRAVRNGICHWGQNINSCISFKENEITKEIEGIEIKGSTLSKEKGNIAIVIEFSTMEKVKDFLLLLREKIIRKDILNKTENKLNKE